MIKTMLELPIFECSVFGFFILISPPFFCYISVVNAILLIVCVQEICPSYYHKNDE